MPHSPGRLGASSFTEASPDPNLSNIGGRIAIAIEQAKQDLESARRRWENATPVQKRQQKLRQKIESCEDTIERLQRLANLKVGMPVGALDGKIYRVYSIEQPSGSGMPALYVAESGQPPVPGDPLVLWSLSQLEAQRDELSQELKTIRTGTVRYSPIRKDLQAMKSLWIALSEVENASEPMETFEDADSSDEATPENEVASPGVNEVTCLTLKQPWAWAIFNAGKDVENRTWQVPGIVGEEIYIHAASSYDWEGHKWIEETFGIEIPHSSKATRRASVLCRELDIVDLPTSSIVGKVKVADITRNHGSEWAFEEHFHWILEEAEEVPFVPCLGKLKLWKFEMPEASIESEEKPDPTEDDWSDIDAVAVQERRDIDEKVEDYRDWEIYVGAPNEGIIDISVVKGDRGSYLYSEFWNKPIDLDWHIQQAKAQIDRLETSPGQLSIDLSEATESKPAQMSDIEDCWFETAPKNLELAKSEEPASLYRGWKIYPQLGNGAYLGVSVVCEDNTIGYDLATDGAGHEYDKAWHVELAKRQIDRQQPEYTEGQYLHDLSLKDVYCIERVGLDRGIDARRVWAKEGSDFAGFSPKTLEKSIIEPLSDVPDWYDYAVEGERLVRVTGIEDGLVYVNHPHSGVSTYAIEDVIPLHVRFNDWDDLNEEGVRVPLEWIEVSPELQPRTFLDREAIEEYAEMLATTEAPPVEICIVEGKRYLVHGNHRLEAYRRAGRATISAKVRYSFEFRTVVESFKPRFSDEKEA
ncbi:MAG: ParB N-terminal domain-containing protein [Cyanobacteria bacterium SID2]|nr:ParB N-terminal domain-containing protein [Cyanobacteria bacterium SID2]